MKNGKNIKLLVALAAGVILPVILLASLLVGRGKVDSSIDSVSVQKANGTLTVSRDGSVMFKNKDGVSYDSWSSDKIDAFFGYFDNNYTGNSDIVRATDDSVSISKGGKSYVYVLGDDELYNLASEDAQTPDSSSDSSSGGNSGGVSQYFSPTPTSNSNSNSTPTPTPYVGGGGSGECLYWRISYCVLAKTPAPTPTPTLGPDANVIESADCGEWVGKKFVPTIISNTLCLPSPTP